MKNEWLVILLIAWMFQACGNEEGLIPDDGLNSNVGLNDNQKQFDDAMLSKSGDDFELLSAVLHDDYLEVNVAYSGGCKEHDFELVYASPKDSTDLIEMVIVHDSNNDECEAYFHETIRIEFVDFPGITASLNAKRVVRLFNGFNLKLIVLFQGLSSFPEGKDCELIVSTEDVVCGDGLFQNRWFKYSPDSGQSFLLQPVSLAILIQLSGKIEEGDYRIGAKFFNSPDHGYNRVLCLAYPGPSIPIEIWCIEKIE